MERGLGIRIREAREAARLSQPELARAVGTTQSHVWSWEAGEKAPGANYLAALARTLGVSADWLLGLPLESGR